MDEYLVCCVLCALQTKGKLLMGDGMRNEHTEHNAVHQNFANNKWNHSNYNIAPYSMAERNQDNILWKLLAFQINMEYWQGFRNKFELILNLPGVSRNIYIIYLQ